MSAANADRSCLYAEGGSRVITVPESMSMRPAEKTEPWTGNRCPPTLMSVSAT
jgi:hypothetical protein